MKYVMQSSDKVSLPYIATQSIKKAPGFCVRELSCAPIAAVASYCGREF